MGTYTGTTTGLATTSSTGGVGASTVGGAGASMLCGVALLGLACSCQGEETVAGSADEDRVEKHGGHDESDSIGGHDERPFGCCKLQRQRCSHSHHHWQHCGAYEAQGARTRCGAFRGEHSNELGHGALHRRRRAKNS